MKVVITYLNAKVEIFECDKCSIDRNKNIITFKYLSAVNEKCKDHSLSLDFVGYIETLESNNHTEKTKTSHGSIKELEQQQGAELVRTYRDDSKGETLTTIYVLSNGIEYHKDGCDNWQTKCW